MKELALFFIAGKSFKKLAIFYIAGESFSRFCLFYLYTWEIFNKRSDIYYWGLASRSSPCGLVAACYTSAQGLASLYNLQRRCVLMTNYFAQFGASINLGPVS
jgi:hypothetical protein